MGKDVLRYDRLVEDALRGIVRQVLGQAAQHGLPGNHHFYLTFRTDRPDVGMPDYLRANYPEEMTIVLQHQFWGLEVGPDSFSVTLSFNNVPERLTVPFTALTGFADPSVKFGLQFQATPPAPRRDPVPAEAGLSIPQAAPKPEAEGDSKAKAKGRPKKDAKERRGEVVALDAFRNKK
jgi:hypothetical protein